MMRRTDIVALALGTLISALLFAQASPEPRPIDTRASKLIVHVAKAGVFSAFGDNHEVQALISEGTIDEARGRVEFVIDSRTMKVLDPQMSPDKRREVQDRMLGPEVLDVERFPRIAFTSTDVQQHGPGGFVVRGKLSLHGVSRQVVVSVAAQNGHYTGTSVIKQREFGITPVRVAGGTVKVKDELKIEFDIATAQSSSR